MAAGLLVFVAVARFHALDQLFDTAAEQLQGCVLGTDHATGID
ncbi:hypothetical protein [Pseudomonas sp. BBP2017]|nr:hypothetical protein [Pseudomonas sp. BBP2017]